MKQKKFKAWDKTNGEWYMDGDAFDLDHSGKEGLFLFDNDHPKSMRTVELEWVQYTGLKDKNGVEIYGNDLIKDGFGNILLVDFRNGSWVLVQKPICRAEQEGEPRHDLLYDYSDNLEIIGNAFQNPEPTGA